MKTCTARFALTALLWTLAAGCAAYPTDEVLGKQSGAAGAGTSAAGPAAVGGMASSAGAPAAPSGVGPVGMHGALRVMGNRVVDAAGEPVQLRGMSLFWSQWSQFYSGGTVDQLADDWQATLVRAVLGVENGGYLESPAANEAKVVAVVDRAIQRGMYVIIDWHDHHAQDHQKEAVDFFTRMAKKYGNSPGVLFEIYNEPLAIDWSVVKAYAEPVLAAIRGTGANNLVIVGTPKWSQDVDFAAMSPITTDTNVAYTLHFYAATHKQWLRDKAQRALDGGLALFVTEWGSCEASGNGRIDQAETATWLDFLSQHQISWANWSLHDKAEACSALVPGTGLKGPWTGTALTVSGTLVKARIP